MTAYEVGLIIGLGLGSTLLLGSILIADILMLMELREHRKALDAIFKLIPIAQMLQRLVTIPARASSPEAAAEEFRKQFTQGPAAPGVYMPHDVEAAGMGTFTQPGLSNEEIAKILADRDGSS